jgi:hypothetical protein
MNPVDVILSSMTWFCIAATFASLAGLLKWLTSASFPAQKNPAPAHPTGNAHARVRPTGAELTKALYEAAYRGARHHYNHP